MESTATESVIGSFMMLSMILIVIFGYFLPFIVAASRDHHNLGPIAIVNVCLGWTFIGWVVALVWAASSPAPSQRRDAVVSERRTTATHQQWSDNT